MTKLLRAALLLFWAAALHAQEWQAATPESQGMDSAALAQLVEYGGNVRMDSLVVVRNGRIVAEAYYAPYRADMLHRINSSTKAVVGALTGIAIARGDMPATGTPALELLPHDDAGDPRWKAITLQHLLDMTSGIDWTEPLSDAVPKSLLELENSSDWQRYILGRGIRQAPGAGFDYNSGGSHLVAVALARKAGMPLERYAEEHLFRPIGIGTWRWRQDPQKFATGGAGLYMRTRDMARFGQLYLQGGEWNGRQVVPRDWVARAFSPQVDMPWPGYKYADYWWSLPARGAYMAVGFNRQVILVMPKLGVVAAFTGREHWRFEDVIAHIERAAKATAPLPPNAQAQEALAARIAAASTGKVTPPSAPAQLPVSRGTWKIDENRTGIGELTLDFSGVPSFHVKLRTRELGGELGLDGRFASATDTAGTLIATTARWSAPDTLEVDQRWPEEAGQMRYIVKFRGDDLEFTSINQFGVRSSARGTRVR
ncbi:serine hydrolase domain-containing protein [Ramlibacter albus]|uniref:Serine hydrolase n=1 Tax=Ramlibacter albus TaxID=2079448 RepID=A0A923M7E3_9BURK|nr:serine hydrolase [Ramlibacter albus]MBC5765213.1 serine hydrolase [Ramlibacter albus]